MCSIRPLKEYFVYEQGELVNYLMTSVGYISIVHSGAQSMTVVDKGCDDCDFYLYVTRRVI